MGSVRLKLFAVVALAVATLACPASALDDASDCEVARTRFVPVEAMWDGRLAARECALEELAKFTDDGFDNSAEPSTYTDVRRSGILLQRYYIRRAQLQQTFLDISALGTIVGSSGALVGNRTTENRTGWAIAAFVPSVVSQFNAFQPKRELYHGGALAVQLITARYDRIIRTQRLLQDLKTTPCDKTLNLRNGIAASISGRDAIANYDKERLLTHEAARLHETCTALNRHVSDMQFANLYVTQINNALIANYANDLLTLDQALLAKDRSLRFTPVETLNAFIASPLRAVDLIITGQDTKSALDTLRTQVVFSGLNRSLAQTPLPPLPLEMPISTIPPASAAVAALDVPVSLGLRSTPDERRKKAEADHAKQIVELALALATDQRRIAFQHALLADMLVASRADFLTFQYDAPTQTTTVTVAPRPSAPTITASTSATAN